jgi:hypothetical protein
MLTPHPTLLIGPSDWLPERMPLAEFTRRIDALWASHPQAERAVVFGNSRHHAELSYFTNLIPKLGPSVALLSRTGEHRMFVGDAANMLGAARPLTWIENVASMKDAAAAIATGKAGPRSLLVGADYMPLALHRTITEALGGEAAAIDATPQVWSQMRRKSHYELSAIDAAMKTIGVARTAMREALMSGADVTEVILAGERAAGAAGAQDVRTLFSLDGGRTLRPFDAPTRQVTDPLLAYLAVRRFNYWAECFPLFTTRPQPTALTEAAWSALESAWSAIKPGVATEAIRQSIAARIEPFQAHPMTVRAFAQRMGLALDEPPHTDIGETFEAGEAYSLRVGAIDGSQGLICSCMFVLDTDGIVGFDDGLSA